MLQTDKTKWCFAYDTYDTCCTDNGIDGSYSEAFDSFEEAMSEAIGYLKLQTGDTVWIGHPSYYVPEVDAENVVNDIMYDAMKETDNWSEEHCYLRNVSADNWRALRIKLTKVYREWERLNGYTCKAFVVKDAKEYTVGENDL